MANTAHPMDHIEIVTNEKTMAIKQRRSIRRESSTHKLVLHDISNVGHTEAQTDSQMLDIQKHRQTFQMLDIQKHRQTVKYTYSCRQTDTQSNTNSHVDRQTDRQTDTQTGRQTE